MRLFFEFFVAKLSPFLFYFFYRSLQNRTRLKGPPFHFFRHCTTFFDFFFKKLVVQTISPIYSFSPVYKGSCLLFKRNLQNRTGPKGPPFRFFFGFATFSKFFLSPKGPSFKCFDVLQQTGLQKAQRVPLLSFSAL